MRIKVKGYTATATSRIKTKKGNRYKTIKYKVKSHTKRKGRMGSNQYKKKK